MSKFKDFILSLFSKNKNQNIENEVHDNENNLTWNIPTNEIISKKEIKEKKYKIPKKKVIFFIYNSLKYFTFNNFYFTSWFWNNHWRN